MMGGDGSRFSKNDEEFLLFNCVFVFDLLCLLVGPHPPNGYNPPLREEDFFCVTCVVLSSLVCWLAFCVLTCLLFYVFEFVYIAPSAE
jgi:hypothetical protein